MEELPRAIESQPIYVLIDDSDSMKRRHSFQSPVSQSEAIIKSIEDNCAKTGCSVKLTKLSELNPLVNQGYTPLNESLNDWIEKTSDEAWIIFSDGGDYQPTTPWKESLKGKGKESFRQQTDSDSDSETKRNGRGLIIGFTHSEAQNTWLEKVEMPPFAFEQKPIFSEAQVTLNPPAKSDVRIQIQATLNQSVLASDNVTFSEGQSQAIVSLPISSLPRGRHLITFKALATADEKVLWDNEVHKYIEVLPNTVGILHLLGSPSWDGRFLRRFLKSEPKYDLISFFILRDPWDSQGSNERELSLIPFPVARLFNEELPNFRVVILQNFTLLQFLMPEYQENLVKFVKDGGGLLFLGGHRALLDADLNNSPLKEILPFTSKGGSTGSGLQGFPMMGDMQRKPINKTGPWFDQDLGFRVGLAQPTMDQRALANVYDDWEALAKPLSSLPPLHGIHHMENVTFKSGASTPLLNAITDNGDKIPLSVASYPGKGRAIWLFTDNLWKLAITDHPRISREVYERFFNAAMIWLLRQDIRKPLIASDFKLSQARSGSVYWSARLNGPAIPYLTSGQNWLFKICGLKVPSSDIFVQKTGNQNLSVSGNLKLKLRGGERCNLDLSVEHPAFGSINSRLTAIFPPLYPDKKIGSSAQKLTRLSELTQAKLVLNPKRQNLEIQNWFESISHSEGVVLPKRYKTHPDHFWFFNTAWVWILLLFIPLEVLCRRWHLISNQ